MYVDDTKMYEAVRNVSAVKFCKVTLIESRLDHKIVIAT